MLHHMLPVQWETTRLGVADSALEEVDALQQVYDACAYIGEWTGDRPENQPAQPILKALQEGDLPPGGTTEFFRLQSIRIKANRQLIGYMMGYHGYPTPEVFWIGFLGIHPQYQNYGYGLEFVRGLIESVASLKSYNTIRLGVALKNWPALRFWIKAGFDRIVQIRGDKVYSEQSFAFLILEQQLEGGRL